MVEEGKETTMAEPQKFTPKSAPCSPIVIRKRPLRSTFSLSPQPAIHYRKKTRDLPNISNCHSCGLRFPDKGRNESLQALNSQWRVVLLCSGCLKSIRAAKVCSYCFSVCENAESGGFIDCRQCRCRVHLSCIPQQRGYVVPLDLDPCYFTCVDCCALPKYFSTKRGSYGGNCSVTVSRVDLEGVVRDANSVVAKKAEAASRAKEKALEKAIAAKHAAELARSALDLAVLVSKGSPEIVKNSSVLDEELALRLHRAMNGSHRISKNDCSISSKRLFDLKEEIANGCKEAQVCVENKCLGQLDSGDSEPLADENVSENHSDLNLDSWNGKLEKENSEQSQESLEELPANEGQASCSEKVVNSAGDDVSDGSVSASCQISNGSYGHLGLLKGCDGGEGEDSTATQQKETCSEPDRYLKKYYCRRNFKLRETIDNKESVGSAPVLVPHLHLSCSNASRTLSNAPYESPTAAMHVSANQSGLSGCGS